jgi:hypothetical protein
LDKTLGSQNPPREGLALQRFLALFLFAGAASFWIGAIAAVAPALSGDMRAIGMFTGTGLSAWTLGWLGMVLWSGRTIPKWFMASFLWLIGAGPLLLAFLCDTWMESLTLVGMVAPIAMSVPSVLRNYPAMPPKPKTFDEL